MSLEKEEFINCYRESHSIQRHREAKSQPRHILVKHTNKNMESTTCMTVTYRLYFLTVQRREKPEVSAILTDSKHLVFSLILI